jgi:hypothetical protein
MKKAVLSAPTVRTIWGSLMCWYSYPNNYIPVRCTPPGTRLAEAYEIKKYCPLSNRSFEPTEEGLGNLDG